MGKQQNPQPAMVFSFGSIFGYIAQNRIAADNPCISSGDSLQCLYRRELSRILTLMRILSADCSAVWEMIVMIRKLCPVSRMSTITEIQTAPRNQQNV